ncbi:DNA-binding SARP family transcriptional activator [Polaribacter sp. Hel1_33_96]|nr:DNA-binding SARP family transcriptional activator [Polaribacter sp. Hel1_33_96]
MLLKKIEFSLIFQILLLGCLISSLEVSSQEYGLNFKGQSYLLDERTGLEISPNEYIKVKNEFEVSFGLKLDFKQKGNGFGYVFRIISKENKNIDLLLSGFQTKSLILVVGDTQTTLPIDLSVINKNDWFDIKIKFFLNKNEIQFSASNSKPVFKTVALNKQESFKLFFGANNYKEFSSSDVPEMNIRDLKLTKNGSLFSHFPLNQCGGNTTSDVLKHTQAILKNPNWILCRHQNWNLNFSSITEGVQLVASNEEKGIIYLLNETSVLTYSTQDNTIKRTPYKNGKIDLTLAHRAIYNTNDNQIYIYAADKELYSYLNLETGKWNNLETFSKKTGKLIFQKHNNVFNPSDNSIYMLGGYGQYKYNNIVRKLNLTDSTWTNLPTNDSIFKPRYLAGSAIFKDSIYILGGYGSASGSQVTNPRSYSSLIAFSIKSKRFKHKFNIINPFSNDMIVANKMWINPDNRDYFALVSDKIKYEGYLKLLKGNLDNNSTTIVGDSIPFKFLDIKSVANLYYMPNQKKLVAYNSFLNKENKNEFSINSIDFPAIKMPIKTAKSTNYWYWIFGGVTIIGLIVLYVVKRKKRKQSVGVIKEKKVVVLDAGRKEIENIDIEEKDLDFKPIEREYKYQIIFFGGFQVINKNREDITGKFSPLLKELFLLIWMYTFKNNKGISSSKLIEILWYDKPTRSAQNNRSVNITKLKNLIKELGDCTIDKETGYWKINHNYKALKTDYYEVIQITKNKKTINRDRIDHLIKITQKGPFLSNLNYEWLDSFKQDVADAIIETLINFAESFDFKTDPDFILHLCDCIFNFDSINEEAVVFKCKAYNYKGNHSLAESTFKKFQKEYKLLYAQDYEYSFQEILENKNQ